MFLLHLRVKTILLLPPLFFWSVLKPNSTFITLRLITLRGCNTDVHMNCRAVTLMMEHILEHLDSHWRLPLRSSLYLAVFIKFQSNGILKKVSEQNKHFMAFRESVNGSWFYLWCFLHLNATCNKNVPFVQWAFYVSWWIVKVFSFQQVSEFKSKYLYLPLFCYKGYKTYAGALMW